MFFSYFYTIAKKKNFYLPINKLIKHVFKRCIIVTIIPFFFLIATIVLNQSSRAFFSASAKKKNATRIN